MLTVTIRAIPGDWYYRAEYDTDDPTVLATMLGTLAAQLIADNILSAQDVLAAVGAAIDSEEAT